MKCPGQDSRYWKPGAIYEVSCPKCGTTVEFFKDDPTRKCSGCGHRFINPELDFGCAAYCEYAEQCIGNLPAEVLSQKQDLLKDRVAIEVKRSLRGDFKRVGRAMRTARYAEKICRGEGANPAVVLSAAHLINLGLPGTNGAASDAGAENAEKARELLSRLGADNKIVEEVSDIVRRHHRPEAEESLNFKVVYDADAIAGMEEEMKENGADSIETTDASFSGLKTDSGRKLAQELLSRSIEGSRR